MKTQTAAYTSVITLLIAVSTLTGQITVPIDTSTLIIDEDSRVITQTGTTSATGTDFRRFTFQRLDDVLGGAFAGETLLGVRVTITNQFTGTFSVTVVNNDPSDNYIGPSGDYARTNFNLPVFSFGANTLNEDFSPAITSGDFLAASPITLLDLFGVGLSANGGQTSITDIANPTTTEVRNVNSVAFGDYSGTGSFHFDVRAAFGLETVISGQNMSASQSTGDSQFTATVEYFIIPEPSTYAAILGVLALGFIVIRRRLNRR